ncbi:hypothetical protein C8J57DRAFT_1515720 [Mycena rebaudengoi]|nr:hypothetical protein C8J57DRAFT_1515720 [Mycena rebaudengoi]
MSFLENSLFACSLGPEPLGLPSILMDNVSWVGTTDFCCSSLLVDDSADTLAVPPLPALLPALMGAVPAAFDPTPPLSEATALSRVPTQKAWLSGWVDEPHVLAASTPALLPAARCAHRLYVIAPPRNLTEASGNLADTVAKEGRAVVPLSLVAPSATSLPTAGRASRTSLIGDALGPPQILVAIGLILMASWLLVLLAASKLRFLTGVCKPPQFWSTDSAQLVSASSGSAGQAILTSGDTNDIMGSTGSDLSHSVHATPHGNHGHPSPSVAAGSSRNATASTVTGSQQM